MKPLYSRIFIGVIFLFFTIAVAAAKVPLSKLFISGGKLPQPVEITEAKLLQASNPWFGTFIPQWNQDSLIHIEDAPEPGPVYELSFYAKSSENEAGHIVYVAYYAFDPGSHRGFIYLPGRHEQWYGTNAHSILRPRQDGHWNLADPAWCDHVNSAIVSGAMSYARADR